MQNYMQESQGYRNNRQNPDQVHILPMKYRFKEIIKEREKEENGIKSLQREIQQIKRKSSDDLLMQSKYNNRKEAYEKNQKYLFQTRTMLNDLRESKRENLTKQKERNQFMKMCMEEGKMKRENELRKKRYQQQQFNRTQRNYIKNAYEDVKQRQWEMNCEKAEAIRQMRCSSASTKESNRYDKKKNREAYINQLIYKEQLKKEAAMRREQELEREKNKLLKGGH